MIKNMLLFKDKSVLFAEEDNIIRANMTGILVMLFGKVLSASNGEEAYELYKNESPDIIMTDVNISKKNGIELIKKIRQEDYNIPVILLSTTSDQFMLAQTNELSLDGYLVKPVEVDKLTHAICKAIQRRPKSMGLIALSDDFLYNLDTKELCKNGSVVVLGVKEQEFLQLLIKNRHRTVTKQEIAKALWPLDSECYSAVKNIVLRVRKKLRNDIIISVRGIGYRLNLNEV